MAKVWKAALDLTFNEGEKPEHKHHTIASMALDAHYKTGDKKINVLVDGAVRVEVQITNNCVRIMECVAEIPLVRELGSFMKTS